MPTNSKGSHGKGLRVLIGSIFIITTLWIGCQTTSTPIPSDTEQMLLVIMPTPIARLGKMMLYERLEENNNWTPVKSDFPVVVGKNGLAWGKGIHAFQDESLPIKQEGDGKSPAGIFTLGSGIGFAPKEEMSDLKIPYTQVTNILECIDDSQSRYYNSVVENTAVDSVDWTSSERMHRYTQAYDLGVFVKHNCDPTEPGAGSCIFLHVWSGPGGYTAGCTAMSRDDMDFVLHWLDEKKSPLLVQLTQSAYRKLKMDWVLPSLDADG